MSPLDNTYEKQFKVIGTRPPRPDGIEKVTGKAQYGADLYVPDMLYAKILRSPHPHAKIISIDTSEAEKLDGVKAVVTSKDFSKFSDNKPSDTLVNCIAHEKALYDGHCVAAVAALSNTIAKSALKLINVEYEILPHVTDVDEAMKTDSPIVNKGYVLENVPKGFSENVTSYYEFGHGDLDNGFNNADLIVERTFKTEAAHQGYIEPHACLASMTPDGKADLWCCTQGHYNVRALCADIMGMESSQLRVTPSEIGGGFGGKTTIFIEPIALALSLKSGKPVKLVMTRDEVFKATGPTVSSSMDVKIGMTKDGIITAGEANLRYQGGAFPNGTVEMGAQSAFAAYDLKAVRTKGWNVLTNRPKQAAYRAPGAPQAIYAVESVVDELCQKLNLDPLEIRIKNAAKKGTKSSYGPTFDDIGLIATLEAAKKHPHYLAPLEENQGRGLSCGFWVNFGGDGSRVTFAVGLATIKAARAAIKEMCKRVSLIWGIDEDAVRWENGSAIPAGPNAGQFEPMSIEEIAAMSSQTGGPIAGHHEVNAEGAGVSFGVHLADVEVDKETGSTKVIRYTVFQDAGKAIHPSYVEGQMQGGAVQGIGWALNEEYIYGKDGRLQNAGFLDYRIPVASDLPMIEPVILEIPNPGHPYGVRGVGETPIVPPLAAINNAVSRATNIRFSELPLSPPKVLSSLKKEVNDG